MWQALCQPAYIGLYTYYSLTYLHTKTQVLTRDPLHMTADGSEEQIIDIYDQKENLYISTRI